MQNSGVKSPLFYSASPIQISFQGKSHCENLNSGRGWSLQFFGTLKTCKNLKHSFWKFIFPTFSETFQEILSCFLLRYEFYIKIYHKYGVCIVLWCGVSWHDASWHDATWRIVSCVVLCRVVSFSILTCTILSCRVAVENRVYIWNCHSTIG